MPQKQMTKQVITHPSSPASHGHFSIEQLTLPAALFENGQLVTTNAALNGLIPPDELKTLLTDPRVDQAINETNIIHESISFDLAVSSKTYRCTASPVLQTNQTLIVFEDISAEIIADKHNALLYRLTLLFSSSKQSINETLQTAIDQILFELAIFDCSILLFNQKTGELKPIAWGTTNINSSIDGTSTFGLGQGIAGHVAVTLKPVVIPNVFEDPRFIRRFTDDTPVSLLCVPIHMGDRLFGVLSLSRNPQNTFNDRDVQFFLTVASRLGALIAMDKSRRHDEKEAELVEALISPEHTNNYQKVMEIFADLLDVDECSLYDWNKENKSLKLLGQVAGDPQKVTQIDPSIMSPALFEKPWVKHDKGIIFPLGLFQKPLGLIYACNTKWERVFRENELAMGSSLATQISNSLSSARLYDEILEERNMMQQVLDSLKDGILLYTPEWRVALYNLATRKLLGIKKEFRGAEWADALYEKAYKYSEFKLTRHFDAKEFFDLALKQGRTSVGLATLDSKPPRTIEISTGPVYDRQRNISGVLSHGRDITQIHDLQSKMAARVQQLTHLFKISSVTGFNSQQITRRILRLTLDLLNVKSAQLVLKDPDSGSVIVSEVSGDKALSKAIAAKLKKKNDWVCENRQPIGLRVKPQKDAPPAHVLIVPVIGHQDKCLGTLTVIDKENHSYFSREDTNLLAIVATQVATKLDNAWLLNQIEEERNKFANIIDQSVDGIFVTDSDANIQIWNKALERLTGLTQDEVVGKHTLETQEMIERLETVAVEEGVTEIKVINKKTGRPIWLGVAYAPIEFNKQTTGYVAIIRDISRQKELERSKNDFVSTASHELRSPITAIVGYLSMLQRGDAGKITNRQQAFFVEKAYNNAKRMVVLIEDILMTTRVENGQLRYQLESVHLADLIDTILADLRFKAEEKNITVSYSKKDEVRVHTDKDAIIQVMSNIITNAIKYTPTNGHVDISFKQDKVDNRPVLITMIKDDGVGIDPVDQDRIFDKFSRIDNPLSVSAGGTGLGLYITKTIVEELGGKIWIESEKGKGSTFYISLPVARHSAKKGII